MPLPRQLEFAFKTKVAVPSIFSLRERRVTKWPGEGHFIGSNYGVDLKTKASELMRSLGAARVARDLRVEWNYGSGRPLVGLIIAGNSFR